MNEYDVYRQAFGKKGNEYFQLVFTVRKSWESDLGLSDHRLHDEILDRLRNPTDGELVLVRFKNFNDARGNDRGGIIILKVKDRRTPQFELTQYLP